MKQRIENDILSYANFLKKTRKFLSIIIVISIIATYFPWNLIKMKCQ